MVKTTSVSHSYTFREGSCRSQKKKKKKGFLFQKDLGAVPNIQQVFLSCTFSIKTSLLSRNLNC